MNNQNAAVEKNISFQPPQNVYEVGICKCSRRFTVQRKKKGEG
jgi:hypothetical protein